ncbi:hypothetical protein GLOIN_2v1659127 [Rhizophagus clarus]|uniref:Uncharacterized protein n=1 Tax=Rhizophagus clarus TaxID=94130 RepID=A0A8H3R1G7_9GLOM|nr:hypothetical protein GLOIN_2v1659127 [Rhizophagus clarus]
MNEYIVKMESRLIRKSEKWNDLIEEYNLFSAYKDINKIYECIQYFRRRKKLAIEFHAINKWLLIPQSKIQAEYWKNRFHHILRLFHIRPCLVKKKMGTIFSGYEVPNLSSPRRKL